MRFFRVIDFTMTVSAILIETKYRHSLWENRDMRELELRDELVLKSSLAPFSPYFHCVPLICLGKTSNTKYKEREIRKKYLAEERFLSIIFIDQHNII